MILCVQLIYNPVADKRTLQKMEFYCILIFLLGMYFTQANQMFAGLFILWVVILREISQIVDQMDSVCGKW